jgi:hypothetical protein
MRYWVQFKARDGGWIDHMGTMDLDHAKKFAIFLKGQHGKEVRVVVRVDKEVYTA